MHASLHASGSLLALPAAGVLTMLLGPATAQVATAKALERWRLPPDAFVEYARTGNEVTFDGDRRMLMPGPRTAPGFYAYEVAGQKTVAWRSSTLAGIGPQLALSLSGWKPRRGARARVTRRFDHVHRFGSIRASGTVTTRDVADLAAVRQTGSFRLDRVEGKFPFPVARNWGRRALFGVYDLDGAKVDFERRVDAVRGVVAELTTVVSGTLRDPNRDHGRSFRVEETWKLTAVRPHGWGGFQHRVDAAIDAGVKFLDKQLDTWVEQGTVAAGVDGNRSYGTGRLALVLLTLVKGNPDRQTPRIQDLLGELRRRRPIDTYSLGVSLMALEACYAPPNEAEQLRQGLIDGPQPRRVPAEDLARMQRWTNRLLRNVDTRVDRGYLFRFNYVAGPRYDNSVTQYGVLGLFSAALSGVKIPATVWVGLTRHYLAVRSRAEGERQLRLPGYGRPGTEADRRGRTKGTRARPRSAEVAGFGYVSPNRPTGSMTCAGLTGLGICRALLSRQAGVPRGLLADADRALRGAFAWIHDNYDVRANPRQPDGWFFYYLYGLERACEIHGVARIGDRDWYHDGAMQLLGMQHGNGSWGSLEDSCFAILFLRKAVAPVLTGR